RRASAVPLRALPIARAAGGGFAACACRRAPWLRAAAASRVRAGSGTRHRLPVRQSGHGRRQLRGTEGAGVRGGADPPGKVRQQQVGPGRRIPCRAHAAHGAQVRADQGSADADLRPPGKVRQQQVVPCACKATPAWPHTQVCKGCLTGTVGAPIVSLSSTLYRDRHARQEPNGQPWISRHRPVHRHGHPEQENPMGALKPAIGWLLGGIGALALGLLATQMPPARRRPRPGDAVRRRGPARGRPRPLAFSGTVRGGPGRVRRRYHREMFLAMGAYVVAVLVTVSVLRAGGPDGTLRVLVALLPVPPIAFVLRAVVRYIRGVDEMQQRIELEAVSLATALVALLYMSGGFLQAAKMIDLPAAAVMTWVFPLLCFAYGVVKFLVVRRYR